jgi:hypothetical protein
MLYDVRCTVLTVLYSPPSLQLQLTIHVFFYEKEPPLAQIP